MHTPFSFLVLVLALLTLAAHGQTQIDWFSTQDAVNVTGDGVTPLDEGFRFELGVFSAGFTPTPANIADWSQNWRPAKRTRYKADLKRYADSFSVTDNTAPFTAGKPAYVWGFKGDPAKGEWILFRANSWVWPSASFGPPSFVLWDARDATAVTGDIRSTGSPYLMKTATVENLAPPTTTWAQWVSDELEGETLTAPHEDADGDGEANVFGFIFGTSPKMKNPPTPVPFSIANISGTKYLQLSVPRRTDRPATVVVEVSGNLTQWSSGPEHTVVVSSTGTSLVVRDLTPVSPPDGKRFIRVRASVP